MPRKTLNSRTPLIAPHTLVCLCAFLLSFGTTLVYHATPFYIFDHLGGDARMSGNFGAAQAIAYVVVALLSVRLIANTSRGFNLAMFGTGTFAFTFGVIPFIHTPWIAMWMSAAGLGGMALTWPAYHSWIGGEPDPVQRARHMGWLNVGWSCGAAVSPLFAGPLYDLDYHYPFYGAIGITLFLVVVLRTIPNEHAHFGEASQQQLDARADHDRAAEIFLWPAWLSLIVFNALNAALRNVFPKRIEELVDARGLRWLAEADAPAFLTHNPATIFSVLAFGMSAGTAVAFFIMGRTRAWKHRFATILIPQAIAMAGVYVLATSHSLLAMAAACAAIGAGLGVCFFNSSYYSLADPALKHRRSAINEGLVGTGSLVGCLAFGQAAAAFGTVLPFLYAPAGIATLAATQYAALRAARRKVT